MGLTVLVISVLEGTGQFGNSAIHKPQVAEFYQCWCFSATTWWWAPRVYWCMLTPYWR